ncbi:hypothetical protein GCM10012284_31340 [Mangrovihabitans endophyticus]|uniref:Uncharacterized protein n=1 Tax=Mangrovihabitans endophyticus TaxID=1751298 RepID=A0A8J3BYU9_9ACTN|nr:hypothetical protein GCM10012284_31340 [Mangrovihabitans endophyticus]
MFASIKNLIPEPRRDEEPRGYVGRHRAPEPADGDVPVHTPAPSEAPTVPVEKPVESATEKAAEKAGVY